MPWARPGSGFTLLFEALLLEFAPLMAVAAIGRMVGEHDTRIWRVLEHYVAAAARAQLDFSAVTKVGVDETSARRGQDYVTLFMVVRRRGTSAMTETVIAAAISGDPGAPSPTGDPHSFGASQASAVPAAAPPAPRTGRGALVVLLPYAYLLVLVLAVFLPAASRAW